MFDPDQFLDTPLDGANDTKGIPIPPGEYTGMIDSAKILQWQKRDDPSVHGLKLQVMWQLDDMELKELLGRDKITIRQDVMLDTTESGGIDMGKGQNVGLGRLREAINKNQPGVPMSQFVGCLAKVFTTNRQDPKDPETVYSEVKAVARLG